MFQILNLHHEHKINRFMNGFMHAHGIHLYRLDGFNIDGHGQSLLEISSLGILNAGFATFSHLLVIYCCNSKI